ncbi:hypothetical protein GCM10009624_19560 [Gordonia sinesedis]
MSTPADIPSVTPTVTLVPGTGIVIRQPAFLCVLGDAARSLLGDILTIQDAVDTPDRTPRRGRHVVRALAQLVATADPDIGGVDIGFAAPDTVGIAIFLAGGVFAEADGRRLVPDPGGTFDRAIPWPSEGLGLYLDGTVPAEPGEERYDLVEGAVPAAGALLHTPVGLRGTEIHDVAPPTPVATPTPTPPPAPAVAPPLRGASTLPPPTPPTPPTPAPPTPTPSNPTPSNPTPSNPTPSNPTPPAPTPPNLTPPNLTPPRPAPEPADPSARTPSPPPAGAGAFQVESLRDAAQEKRVPLPVQPSRRPATEVVRVPESRAHVLGIRCSRGHLNHPRSWLCGVCGIRMDQLTGILVEGERPPLGWLLLDNGSTYLLDENLVLGREPGSVGGSRTGSPKPIRVQDETGQLSRRHIEIRLVDWNVELVDLGSANGTFVSDPASGNRETRLTPQRPFLLAPGSHVRIGGRHFIFESPHART